VSPVCVCFCVASGEAGALAAAGRMWMPYCTPCLPAAVFAPPMHMRACMHTPTSACTLALAGALLPHGTGRAAGERAQRVLDHGEDVQVQGRAGSTQTQPVRAAAAATVERVGAGRLALGNRAAAAAAAAAVPMDGSMSAAAVLAAQAHPPALRARSPAECGVHLPLLL